MSRILVSAGETSIAAGVANTTTVDSARFVRIVNDSGAKAIWKEVDITQEIIVALQAINPHAQKSTGGAAGQSNRVRFRLVTSLDNVVSIKIDCWRIRPDPIVN